MEVWADIKGFEGIYKISSYGRVLSCKRDKSSKSGYKYTERILSPSFLPKRRYESLVLKHDGLKASKYIHRLVAQAFIPNPENKLEVNHKDANRRNNRLENLEWCTRLENIQHSHRMGLVKSRKGRKLGPRVPKAFEDYKRKTNRSEIQSNRVNDYRHRETPSMLNSKTN